MALASYKELIVWRKSMDLCKEIYHLASKLPSSENFGLRSQITRCAVSIPSNIAEGQQRNSKKEYRQFVGIARGSAAELDTQIILLNDVYGLDTTQAEKTVIEIQKMLNVLSMKLKD